MPNDPTDGAAPTDADGAQPTPQEESRIVIRPDGEVVIENLSELLAEVALTLDPEDADLTCRLELPKNDLTQDDEDEAR